MPTIHYAHSLAFTVKGTYWHSVKCWHNVFIYTLAIVNPCYSITYKLFIFARNVQYNTLPYYMPIIIGNVSLSMPTITLYPTFVTLLHLFIIRNIILLFIILSYILVSRFLFIIIYCINKT